VSICCVGASAVAVPAIPASAAIGIECSYPDLARQLTAIYDRWLAQVRADEVDPARFDARIFEETGSRAINGRT
jgi:hypothetical protein